MEAIRVQFKPLGKRYFFGVGKLKLTDKTKVIVNTVRGIELGYCVGEPFDLDEMQLTSELKDVVRVATDNDIESYEYNKSLEADILAKTKSLSKSHELEMKVLECEYTLDTPASACSGIPVRRLSLPGLSPDAGNPPPQRDAPGSR